MSFCKSFSATSSIRSEPQSNTRRVSASSPWRAVTTIAWCVALASCAAGPQADDSASTLKAVRVYSRSISISGNFEETPSWKTLDDATMKSRIPSKSEIVVTDTDRKSVPYAIVLAAPGIQVNPTPVPPPTPPWLQWLMTEHPDWLEYAAADQRLATFAYGQFGTLTFLGVTDGDGRLRRHNLWTSLPAQADDVNHQGNTAAHLVVYREGYQPAVLNPDFPLELYCERSIC